jgi:hypothetical protein
MNLFLYKILNIFNVKIKDVVSQLKGYSINDLMQQCYIIYNVTK